MKHAQQLEPDDYEKYMIFLEMLLVLVCEKRLDVGKIIFNDEAHFDLHGNENKEDVRYYVETNMNII